MKRRIIIVRGEEVPAPNYKRRPFVWGASVAFCQVCGRAVDTHDAGLPGWEVVKEKGRIVAFTCPDCIAQPDEPDVRVGAELR